METLKIGTLLHTKDGRIIGNAIVIKCCDDDTYCIETDFGGGRKIDFNELNERFHISEVRDLNDWRSRKVSGSLAHFGFRNLAKPENLISAENFLADRKEKRYFMNMKRKSKRNKSQQMVTDRDSRDMSSKPVAIDSKSIFDEVFRNKQRK